jgi:glucose-1-phosphate thymidylyltransferase
MTSNVEPGQEFVGVIPAAGLGSRLGPLGYPKELLPVAFDGTAFSLGMRPKPVMSYSLEMMGRAGVKNAVVVISELKAEIMQVFGSGEAQGLSLSYSIRRLPRGLADAVEAATPWLMGRNVCLALPDTIIEPADAMREVCGAFRTTGADVVLGVFPTPIPEQLGPVRFGADGVVLEVLDKPETCALKNTWAVAAWGPRFTALLSERNRLSAREAAGPVLGEVFQAAVERGLDVRAHPFPTGRFFDMGTSLGWGEFLRRSIQTQSGTERSPLAYAN